MILERDAFTVEYDAILDLGYTPRLSAGTDSAPAPTASDEKIPQSIAAALLAARAEYKSVFIDSYALLCIASQAVDHQTTRPHEVYAALQVLIMVKIHAAL